MKFKNILMILLFFATTHTEAWGACGLSLTTNNITINWTTSYTTQAIQFTLTKALAPACNFIIGITKGGAANYSRLATNGGNQISYQLWKEPAQTNILKDSPDVTSANDVIVGGFVGGPNLNQTITYYLDIPYSSMTTPTLAIAGAYTDTYTIDVYESNDPLVLGPVVTSAVITLTVNVPRIIGLSLVNTGAAYDSFATNRAINWGTMTAGQTTVFDFRVQTNAGFTISFSSAYGGYMRSAPAAAGVPYRFYANNVLLDLSGPAAGPAGPGQTGLQGIAYPIRVVIGTATPQFLLSGSVSDIITVTATTTE